MKKNAELTALERDLRELYVKRATLNKTIAEKEQRRKVLLVTGRKCQICHEQAAEVSWQPFGPAEDCRDDFAFTRPGAHYRGFPVIKICHDCSGEIQNGERISFEYGRPKVTYYLIGELPPLNAAERAKVEED